MGLLAKMRGLAAREPAVGRSAADGLGTSVLAVRAAAQPPLPPDAVPLETADGVAWLAHSGPLRCHLAPFAAAPELGLRLDYCFDASGERQRFALLLAAEAGSVLTTDAVAEALQEAVQGALQRGTLELPPCTSDEEWHAFRAGLNELVYTRFGLVVEDCVPVDLHPALDLAAQLLAAATAGAPSAPPPLAGTLDAAPLADMPVHGWRSAANAGFGAPGGDAVAADALALRRLFLELPALAAGMRALPRQECDGSFAPLQDILRRLALAAVGVNTMPALTHAAPGRRLPHATQQLRAAHARAAQSALDEGWALLACMRGGLDPARLDEADRILSNLEYSLAQRRATAP
ncbi:MAG: hypothetical protein K0R43_567 [Pseudoduganella sp.]|jgi:hypothetical protein|nr:hypothetical protein [Pseudoduganella sp.]